MRSIIATCVLIAMFRSTIAPDPRITQHFIIDGDDDKFANLTETQFACLKQAGGQWAVVRYSHPNLTDPDALPDIQNALNASLYVAAVISTDSNTGNATMQALAALNKVAPFLGTKKFMFSPTVFFTMFATDWSTSIANNKAWATEMLIAADAAVAKWVTPGAVSVHGDRNDWIRVFGDPNFSIANVLAKIPVLYYDANPKGDCGDSKSESFGGFPGGLKEYGNKLNDTDCKALWGPVKYCPWK